MRFARRRESEPELFSLAIKRARVDSQALGGGVEAGRRSKNAPDMLDLDLLDARRAASSSIVPVGADPGTAECDALGKVGESDLGSHGKNGRAFDGVAELAEVAGPRMPHQCVARLAGQTGEPAPGLSGEVVEQAGQAVGRARRSACGSGGRVSSTTFSRYIRSSREAPEATAASEVARLVAATSRTSDVRVCVSPTRSYLRS